MPEDTLALAREAGVHTVIDIAMGLEESRTSVGRQLEGVFVCVGIHPNDLQDFEGDPDGAMSELRRLASRPGVVGVGETGLDFYRDRWPASVQEQAFRAHIDLAKDLDRTLVIHCRDAHERVLDVLDETGPPPRVVMHCFSGDTGYAERCAERGFFCSFAGNITYKRSDELRRAAASIPKQLLLVETDAPFLAPEPKRGRPNHPALLPITANRLASERSVPLHELEASLEDNTRRAFAL